MFYRTTRGTYLNLAYVVQASFYQREGELEAHVFMPYFVDEEAPRDQALRIIVFRGPEAIGLREALESGTRPRASEET